MKTKIRFKLSPQKEGSDAIGAEDLARQNVRILELLREIVDKPAKQPWWKRLFKG